MLIEKDLIQKRFAKAQFHYDEHAVAQRQIHKHLLEMLQQTGRSSFRRILEIGCGTGGFTQCLTNYCNADEWVLNDLCSVKEELSVRFNDKQVTCMQGDAEQLNFPGIFNLITSASTIQWFTDPGYFIKRISKQLPEGGILLFNTFGQDNLKQIKAITGKGLSYPSFEIIKSWLSDSFDIISMKEEDIVLSFNNPLQVLQHLKYTGVTAIDNAIWTKGMHQHFISEYIRCYTNHNQVQLTYQPIYVLALKK